MRISDVLRRLGVFGAGIVIVGLSALPASALSDGFNLTTSPVPLDLNVKPGGTISQDIRVQNSSTSVNHINVSLLKFKADGKDGTPQLYKCTDSDITCSWVSFSRTSFTAQPGEWNSVNMTISPPTYAGFGYYYAVLFSNGTPPKSTKPNSSTLAGAVATLILLDVQAPGEKRQLQIDSFSADHGLYEYLPATFLVKIKNTGNVHAVPSGSIFIKKGSSTIATLDINPGSGNILPNSTRTFIAKWDDGFPTFKQKLVNGQAVEDKKGQPVMQLDWNFAKASHLRVGNFSAQLVATYDNGTRDVPLQSEASFWVLPWKLMLLVLVLLAIVGFGLFSFFRGGFRKAKSVSTRLRK